MWKHSAGISRRLMNVMKKILLRCKSNYLFGYYQISGNIFLHRYYNIFELDIVVLGQMG